MRILAPAITLLLLAVPARHVIPDVPPMAGPDPLVPALARAIRIAADPAITDDYLYGVTGAAFLATVCSNNCTCRDYRDLVNEAKPALGALGLAVEPFDGSDDELWERIRKSIEDGVPVVAWNAFGDFEDSLITGYDEERDLLYGRSAANAGDAYAEAPLTKWREGGMYGLLVRRGVREGVDRGAVERAQLGVAVRMERRPPIEGG